MSPNGIDSRNFIGGLAMLSLIAGGSTNLDGGNSTSSNEIPYRTLGKTGEKVSCIGLGGFHLGKSQLEEADAIKLFQSAIDRGINFSDNAWDYNQGESERRVGKALKGRREKVFVMTKYDGRTKVSALKQLDESLQRLQVDHVDLWQFHENIRLEDPDRFFANGGARKLSNRPNKQERYDMRALPVTKIRAYIFVCSNSPIRTSLCSIQFKCPST